MNSAFSTPSDRTFCVCEGTTQRKSLPDFGGYIHFAYFSSSFRSSWEQLAVNFSAAPSWASSMQVTQISWAVTLFNCHDTVRDGRTTSWHHNLMGGAINPYDTKIDGFIDQVLRSWSLIASQMEMQLSTTTFLCSKPPAWKFICDLKSVCISEAKWS